MNNDYEEMLLQITDVLKAHNRYHMKTPDHEQAVKLIRDIVTPKGKWLEDKNSEYGWKCSECGDNRHQAGAFCPKCGAQMGW